MTIPFLTKYIERGSAADVAKALGEKNYVTTTDVVKVFPSRMEVVKIAAPDHIWLSLEVVFGSSTITAESTKSSIERSGQLVLTRDNSRVVLKEFDATDVGELTKAKASFAEARDQLLREILPANHSGSGSAVSKPQRGLFRRVLSRAMPYAAGAVGVIVLALMFGPRGAAPVPVTAQAPMLGAGEQPFTAEAISRLLPGSSAPPAWAALPDEQKRVLMEAAQRMAGGSKEVNPELAKVLASMNQSNNVGAAAQGTQGRKTAFTTPDENKKIAAATQVRTTQGGTPFYAFVDPMCSACQHLERQLAKLDPKLNFVAIPVGFQGGGRDQAAAALCAKDKVAGWHLAANVQPVGNKACEEGFKQVDANNALFLSMGFDATPTLIAPNGKIAQGSADTEQLAAWVNTNLK